jgi:hypothetical protein
MQKRKKYTPEYKREAVTLVTAGSNPHPRLRLRARH